MSDAAFDSYYRDPSVPPVNLISAGVCCDGPCAECGDDLLEAGAARAAVAELMDELDDTQEFHPYTEDLDEQMAVCDRCGALVLPDYMFMHTTWHARNGESAGIELTGAVTGESLSKGGEE